MAIVWFQKASFSSAYCVGPSKKAVQFEPLDKNHGVLALDPSGPDLAHQPIANQAELIRVLNEAAASTRGGVGRINEEKYNELKKKFPWKAPGPKSWLDEPLRVNGKKENKKKAVVPPVKAEPKAEEIPQRPPDQPDFRTSDFRTSTRRLSSLEASPSEI